MTGKGPIKGKNAEEVVTNNKNCVIDFNIPELKVCSSLGKNKFLLPNENDIKRSQNK